MSSRIVDRGCSRLITQAFQASTGTVTYSVSRYVQTMSVDDGTVAFAAGDSALNSGGAISNEYDAAFDAAPVSGNKTVSWSMTVPTGSGNFTIRRVANHDDTPANVSTSSASLVMGIDGQSYAKTADFALRFDNVLTQNNG